MYMQYIVYSIYGTHVCMLIAKLQGDDVLILHLPQVCVNRNGTNETYGIQGSVAYSLLPGRKGILLILNGTRHSR